MGKKLFNWVIAVWMLPLYPSISTCDIEKIDSITPNNYSFNAHKQIKSRYQAKNRLKNKRPKNSVKKAYYTNKSFKV